MSIKINYNSSTLKGGLDRFAVKIGAAMLMYASTQAQSLKAYMKSNRPWTDRTNMAKATLDARVSQPNNSTIRITLSHGVEYGIWLELAHGKNWAIIAPTIRTQGPRVIKGMGDIMSKIK